MFCRSPLFILQSAIGAALLVVVPSSGADRYSREVPKVTVPLPAVTSITIDAKNVAAGRAVGSDTAPNPEATRTTTTHSATLEVSVANLGADPANVTVHWFWVGRYATSENWFRTGEGEKRVTINPKKIEIIFAESGESEAHVTRSSNEHYKSGGNMLGWVVFATNPQGEIQAIKTSVDYLQGFIAEPPPKKRK